MVDMGQKDVHMPKIEKMSGSGILRGTGHLWLVSWILIHSLMNHEV